MRRLTAAEVTLLEYIQQGDTQAFDTLVAPYRNELVLYCYRFLGSLHDAEDMVQETLLRAWKQIHTFQHFHSFHAWLYKIATNVCLTALARLHRPSITQDDTSEERRLIEPVWLEPLPDDLLTDAVENPEALYTLRESVTLAFLVALQVLPAKQRAVLLLSDVLDWHANEIAQFLDTTVSAVNSLLFRARSTIAQRYHAESQWNLMLPANPVTTALLDRYMRAWEDADVALFAAILREDALFTMPPLPAWYQGRAAICAFVRQELFYGAPSGFGRAIPIQANAQPAFALYRLDAASGSYQAFGISVLTISGDAITAIATFLGAHLFPRFQVSPVLAR
jgi:RNA polymerase sigma-70 factor, ECF subfamily